MDDKVKKIEQIDCIDCGFSFDATLHMCPKCEQADEIHLHALSAVTSRFSSEKGSNELKIDIGKDWPLDTNQICLDFIENIEGKFTSKMRFHSYLSKDISIDSVPYKLNKYLEGKLSFKDLVRFFLENLKDNAVKAGTHLVTGGNIVFMHYKSHEEDDEGKFFAVMVSEKSGFDFDPETQVPRSRDHINLDRLKQAARIDLTLFDEVYPEESHYLQFIQGTSKSEFFKLSFGCDIGNVDNAESIKQIRQAVTDFGKAQKLGPNFTKKSSEAVETVILSAAKSKTAISLKSVINAVETIIPEKSKGKGLFEDFLKSEKYRINPYVQPSTQMAEDGNWVNIETKESSFKGKIQKDKVKQVGHGDVYNVEFDTANQKLIIKLTDPKIIEELTRLTKEND